MTWRRDRRIKKEKKRKREKERERERSAKEKRKPSLLCFLSLLFTLARHAAPCCAANCVYAHLVSSDDIVARSLQPAIDTANRDLADNSETRLTLGRARSSFSVAESIPKAALSFSWESGS